MNKLNLIQIWFVLVSAWTKIKIAENVTCRNPEGCEWACGANSKCSGLSFICMPPASHCRLECHSCDSIQISSSAPSFDVLCMDPKGCSNMHMTSLTSNSAINLYCASSSRCSNMFMECPSDSVDNCQCTDNGLNVCEAQVSITSVSTHPTHSPTRNPLTATPTKRPTLSLPSLQTKTPTKSTTLTPTVSPNSNPPTLAPHVPITITTDPSLSPSKHSTAVPTEHTISTQPPSTSTTAARTTSARTTTKTPNVTTLPTAASVTIRPSRPSTTKTVTHAASTLSVHVRESTAEKSVVADTDALKSTMASNGDVAEYAVQRGGSESGMDRQDVTSIILGSVICLTVALGLAFGYKVYKRRDNDKTNKFGFDLSELENRGENDEDMDLDVDDLMTLSRPATESLSGFRMTVVDRTGTKSISGPTKAGDISEGILQSLRTPGMSPNAAVAVLEDSVSNGDDDAMYEPGQRKTPYGSGHGSYELENVILDTQQLNESEDDMSVIESDNSD